MKPAARHRLIVALDLPNVGEAEAMVDRLGSTVSFYKVGFQLAIAGGLPLVDALIGQGKRVFLDMKLHDIGNTVGKAVESAAQRGVTFLTVHAYPKTMEAAVAARAGSGLQVLAVTVLTSYGDDDLRAAGYAHSVRDLVALRAAQARDCGIDGIVCAPEEARSVRAITGDRIALVTPGIRPAGAAAGDQQRIATPAEAIAAGSDYLVVGRPITGAPDPASAAQAVLDEMEAAQRNGGG